MMFTHKCICNNDYKLCYYGLQCHRLVFNLHKDEEEEEEEASELANTTV